jgi:dipeptide transport system ATP-binding protein
MNQIDKNTPAPILSIQNLGISINNQGISRQILQDVTLDVPKGQTIALLGESGSGKSLAVYSILNLLPDVASITSGTINFHNQDLLSIKESRLRHIRGNQIGMIYQEPGTSLNPLMPVGRQIGETLIVHKKLSRKITREQVLSLMELVGIPDPRRRYNHYPHQLSGGVKQRVVIAMALACRPDLLLADEPTSALDATVQAQILDLLSRLIKDLTMSVLLISHNLGVVAAMADRVAVLQGGYIVETGTVHEVLNHPAHPYTRTLLAGKQKTSKIATLNVTEPGSCCPYANGCKYTKENCLASIPGETIIDTEHTVRCFLYEDKR